MAAIDDSIRAYNSLATQQLKAFTAATVPVQGGPHNLSMALAIGTRVLDLVSGESGTVINGKRENIIIPLA